MGVLPKRKKRHFRFIRKTIPVIWHVSTKQIVRKEMDLFVLGQWGYHGHLFKATGTYSIIHVPSGLLLHRTKTIKEAKVLCKRLHTKNEHTWKPKTAELMSFVLFHKETRDNLKKHTGRRTRFVFKDNNFDIKELEDDIPF